MPYRWVAAVVALQLLPAATWAQHVTAGGWVDRVDATNGTMVIRTLDNPRTISVAPDAVVRVNGAVSRLDRIPLNSQVNVIGVVGPDGVLHATEIDARATTPAPPAAAPTGSYVHGTLVAVDLPNNTITVRTRAGDIVVPLGTAPIYVNGAPSTIRVLKPGEVVEVERTLPTPASTQYVTRVVRVMAPAVAAVASGAATTPRGTTTPNPARTSGLIVRVNIPSNTITVRIQTGDVLVPLGTAPISVNGTRGSIHDLHTAQAVVVERAAPASPGAPLVVRVVRVVAPVSTASVGAQRSGGTSRVRSYRTSYHARHTHRAHRRSARFRLAAKRSAARHA